MTGMQTKKRMSMRLKGRCVKCGSNVTVERNQKTKVWWVFRCPTCRDNEEAKPAEQKPLVPDRWAWGFAWGTLLGCVFMAFLFFCAYTWGWF